MCCNLATCTCCWKWTGKADTYQVSEEMTDNVVDLDVTTEDGRRQAELEMNRMYQFIKSRMLLISSLIGDRRHKSNRRRGCVGLSLWITNMCIHFAIDFYEAVYVFHVSWLTCQIIWLVMFLILSVFLAKRPIRWFLKFTKTLSKEPIYYATMKRLHLVFTLLPLIMAGTSASGAICQYLCYAYDDALQIHFGEHIGETNSTFSNNNVSVPQVWAYVAIGVNVVRFTSLLHIYYVMFLLLFMIVVIFFGLLKSQQQFNTYLGNILSSYPPTITFTDAINKFNARSRILREASENTTIVFTPLMLATSVSFVVNAYNFLFLNKFAIYVWFAVAPLMWNITPLICAALVTSCYKDLKIIVMESWVKIPDEYDETWTDENTEEEKKQKGKKEVEETKKVLERNERIPTSSNITGEVSGIYKRKGSVVERYTKMDDVAEPDPPPVIDMGLDVGYISSFVTKFLQTQYPKLDDIDEFSSLPSKSGSNAKIDMDKESVSNSKVTIDIDSNSVSESHCIIDMDSELAPNSCSNTETDPKLLPYLDCTMEADSNVSFPSESEKNDEANLFREQESAPGYSSNPSMTADTDTDSAEPVFKKRNLWQTYSKSITKSTLCENNKSDKDMIVQDQLDTLNSKETGIQEDDLNPNEGSKVTEKEDKVEENPPDNEDDVKEESMMIEPLIQKIRDLTKLEAPGKNKPTFKAAANAVKALKKMKRGSTRKFNYEKYLRVLEHTLEHTAFSIGKVDITWDRVSFIMALLTTLVGVFAQNVFL